MKNKLHLIIAAFFAINLFASCSVEEEAASSKQRVLNDEQLAYLSSILEEMDLEGEEELEEFVEQEKEKPSENSGLGLCSSLDDVEGMISKIKENAEISEEAEQKLRENLTRACENKMAAKERGNKPDGVGDGKPEGRGKPEGVGKDKQDSEPEIEE
ncbi:MAG: hypothetical protein ACOH5I_09170 [Oligoflexus sp.]